MLKVRNEDNIVQFQFNCISYYMSRYTVLYYILVRLHPLTICNRKFHFQSITLHIIAFHFHTRTTSRLVIGLGYVCQLCFDQGRIQDFILGGSLSAINFEQIISLNIN